MRLGARGRDCLSCGDIGGIPIKTLAAQIRVICAPRAGPDAAIACK